MNQKTGERLAKVMARSGICSRREAERWIEAGRVVVNGQVVKRPALNVTRQDVIVVDGTILPVAEETALWLFHKPKGCIVSRRDEKQRQTIYDVLPKKMANAISIGRLDYNTEGLLLLTNDGELARQMELPASGLERVYRVRVHGNITEEKLQAITGKVKLGKEHFTVKQVESEALGRSNNWLRITLTEGKNREVRKICESIGLQVNRLIRIQYGTFTLGGLKQADVIKLSDKALNRLLQQLGRSM